MNSPTPPIPDNGWRERLREDLKTRIAEGYFIHCKVEKPDFKTADEANNWYEKQNYIAKIVVGSWVDNTMAVIDEAFQQELHTAIEEERAKTRKIVAGMLARYTNKPECTPDYPCGCHNGEVFHADGKCFCDLVEEYSPSDKETL